MLGIVILIYESYNNAIRLVEEIRALPTRHPLRVVIVDNSPSPAYASIICDSLKCREVQVATRLNPQESGEDVFYLPLRENVGFARGNNRGADFLLANFPDMSYLLFSNDDVILSDPNVIDGLCATCEGNAKIGCIGPQIIDADGVGIQQSPHTKISSIFQKTWNRFLPSSKILKAIRYRHRKRTRKLRISVAPSGDYRHILGAFLLFPVRAFKDIGGFDEATFLYWEEFIIGAKLHQRGLLFWFEPSVVVRHIGSASSGDLLSSRGAMDYGFESSCHYYRVYERRCWLTLALYRLSYLIYRNVWWRLLKWLNCPAS